MMQKAHVADCHAHIFGGPQYPFVADPVYLPDASQCGTVQGFLAVLDAHGFTHGLVVQAQPYRFDNRAMLDGIAASKGRLKGVALVAPQVTDRELQALADRGVIGIRFNTMTEGLREFTESGADRLLARIREMGWFLQIHCQHDELATAMPLIRQSRVHVMIDHFGRPDLRKGLSQPGFAALLELGREGQAVVKLSGPFRSSIKGPPYDDVDPYIAAAVEAFTLDRCVFGSDWPFTRTEERIDYGPQAACIARWFPDPADRRKLLWETPRRLFGFSDLQ